MEIATSAVSFCDFIVWTPLEILILRIEADVEFISNLQQRLTSFWIKYVLPELLTRRLENEKPQTMTKGSKEKSISQTYCVCNSTSGNNEMVGCDSCDNWFHPACLKLKRLPTTKIWYCPQCRRKKKKL